MSHSILITGASGYLGGDLIAHLHRTSLPPYQSLYALVRSPEQADAVKRYGATPLILDFGKLELVEKAIIDAKISIIFFLINALESKLQISMIKALGEVKKQIGHEVHFLHTSGAKVFSEFVGFPTNRETPDTDTALFKMQKELKAPDAVMGKALNTNNSIIEAAELHGVRSYIFMPCIVYGKGEGFGNRISIQTTAVVKAAVKVRAVFDVNPGRETIWPVCHVHDNTTLYAQLLQSILLGEGPDHGKNGYYLASSGSVAWIDIYIAMAKSLSQHNIIESADVKGIDESILEEMAEALNCSKGEVIVQVGGTCTLTAARRSKLGWTPEFPPKHILEAADEEVERILEELEIKDG